MLLHVAVRSILLMGQLTVAKSFVKPTLHRFRPTTILMSLPALRSASADAEHAATPNLPDASLIISLQKYFRHVDKLHETENLGNVRLILASQSPRRREILDMMGLQGRFEAIPSPLDETALQQSLIADNSQLSPIQYTRILAEEKARALAEKLISETNSKLTSNSNDDGRCDGQTILVLGSDTIVELDNHILEKPKDIAAARCMLRSLSGRQHKVHTSVALFKVQASDESSLEREATLQASFVDTAEVIFAELSDDDINAYIDTREPMDKAGSYGIQGVGGQLVSRIEGDFFTVMGLPMHPVSRALASAVKSIVLDSNGCDSSHSKHMRA
ncbi:hypothetical protein MPSEU_000393000 [Mayamaea pseudoterrestris]|nr:hypothetical protein MPSEU_000393000 [Mayamaea pseudoterrestris]